MTQEDVVGILGTGLPDLKHCVNRYPDIEVSRNPWPDIVNLQAGRRQVNPMCSRGQCNIRPAIYQDPAFRAPGKGHRMAGQLEQSAFRKILLADLYEINAQVQGPADARNQRDPCQLAAIGNVVIERALIGERSFLT